jgi:PAS domain S-box-containing protein
MIHIPTPNTQLQHEIAERQRMERELQAHIAFEAIIITISADFINLPTSRIDYGIQKALQTVSTFAGVDRSSVFLYSDDATTVSILYEWCASGAEPLRPTMQQVPVSDFAWSNARLQRGEILSIPRMADLPPEAAAERARFEQQRTRSLIAVPMLDEERVIGFLGFDSVCSEQHWKDENITLLKLLGKILVNALKRKQAEEHLRESQRMLSALMSNLPGMVYRCCADEHWTMEFVSEGCIALTGYQPDELTTNTPRMSFADLVHEDDRERVQQVVEQAGQEERAFELTYRLITVSGEEKWVWERGRKVLRAGKTVPLLEGFITDVSERVQAHQQLEQRVAERTRQLMTLLEVQRMLSSRLDPDDVMQMIAEEARQLTGASFGALFVREEEALRVAALAGEYGPEMMVGYRMPLRESATGLAMLSGHAVRIDSLDDPRVNREAMVQAHIQSMIGVPLVSGNQSIGVISVGRQQPYAFGEADEQALTLLAPSAVIALENAHLYTQAQQVAALEERQRLARDLHDAVTQTLFSASMIADVLPRLWERRPDQGRQRLDELRQLTRGALAEMRTLLLELRPNALVEASLADVLRQLGEAVMGRARLPITVTVAGEDQQVSPDVQVVCYRVAQEALNNVVKHAGAQSVAVHLAIQPDTVSLRVSDDGCGFDVAGIEATGHFGLGIMHERAASVGARLRVESEPGQGTTILLTWNNG